MDYQGAPAPQKKKRAYAAQAYDFGANTGAAAAAPPSMVPPAGAGAMDPLAGQFGQMNLGAQQAQQPMMQPMQSMQQPPMPAQTSQLNQRVTTALSSAPFNVYELDQPPPPIILPPNVRDGGRLYRSQC